MTAISDENRMTYLNSPDDHLGVSATRFFGSGYRRVAYQVPAAPVESGGVAVTAGVTYPADWSHKSGHAQLRPHLSTVDALILAARVSETAVVHSRGLSPRQHRSAWLRRVEIKAPTTPYEAGLDAFPLSAQLRAGGAASEAVVDCLVATMRVQCTVAHDLPDGRPAARGLLGAEHPGQFGVGYRHRTQSIADVALDRINLTASAVVDLAGATADGGLEADYQPAASMVDSFVVSLQLGQLLLYLLDGLDRGRSNTLWMRRTVIDRPRPTAARAPFTVSVRLADQRLVRSRGEAWRTAMIVGDVDGVQTRCAVAHQLPATASAAGRAPAAHLRPAVQVG